MKDNSPIYKAVVVGCGRIGSTWDEGRAGELYPVTHAGALMKNPRLQLIAGADPDLEKRKQFTRSWGVPACASVCDLLEAQRPDWVSICTPPDTHLEVALAALETGARAIFCEKPLADSVAAGRELVKACAHHGVVLAVGYQRRWDAGHRQVAQWTAQGSIGRLQRVTGMYVRGVANNGGHLIDLVRMLVGEVRDVRASNTLGEPGPDPSLDLTMRAGNGTPVTLLALSRHAYDVMELDLWGDRGRIQIRDYGNDIRKFSAAPLPGMPEFNVLQEKCQWKGEPLEAALSIAFEDVVQCLDSQGGRVPACTGADGLAVLEVVEQAHSRVVHG